jgi:hypothetical protein
VGGGSGLAKKWRRLVKKKEGLSSFGQKAKGMTERRMKEVVARPLWQLLWLVLGEKIHETLVNLHYVPTL